MFSRISGFAKNELGTKAKRLKSDKKGVAAVEFALIFPIMLLLYIGTMEVSIAVSVDRKMARIASSVGDLVGQSDAVLNGEDIEAILDISQFIMQPYKHRPRVVVSGVSITNDRGEETIASVQWSCSINGAADETGSKVEVPEEIMTADTFLIKTTVSLDYQPVVGWAKSEGTGRFSLGQGGIPLEETIFITPRLSNNITVKGNCSPPSKIPYD